MSNGLNSDQLWAPRLTAALTALLGLVNIASALTPDIRWRGHLLLQFEALETLRFFHALALPAGAALVLIAPYLLKRRRRALQMAIALLVVLGIVDLLKGFDFEEALFGWLLAAAMYRGRRAFSVVHEPISLRSAVWRVPLLGAAGVVIISVADWVEHRHAKLPALLGESGALLRFHRGPLRFESHTAGAFDHYVRFAWIPTATHLIEIGTLVAIGYVIFRPLAAPRSLPGPAARRLAVEVVRRHGSDTLSFFKLRPDKQYFFNQARTAFVGYRIEAGVMLLSGDPVGPPEAFAELLQQVRAFARSRGLKLGAIGASEALLPVYDGLGLRALYLGDEAVIDIPAFSLEGRAIRKVRQSVSRLTKAGYTSELRTLATLDPAAIAEIERVLALGRHGTPERGFSMAMDSIRGACERDTLFVVARDAGGAIRGVLHFVPCYGRQAVSLSFMRRDPETPNGLTEFLVVEAIEHLRERGLQEMSLNFATAARYMHAPSCRLDLAAGWLMRRLNPYFQIESLYRFNAKFFPRWEPRYVVYDGRLGIPRVALAGMWAEGQLAKPSVPRRTRRHGLTRPTLRPANL